MGEDRRLESRPNPQTRMSALRSAGFPACGFWGHSCPHFQELRRHPLLITPPKPIAATGGLLNWKRIANVSREYGSCGKLFFHSAKRFGTCSRPARHWAAHRSTLLTASIRLETGALSSPDSAAMITAGERWIKLPRSAWM